MARFIWFCLMLALVGALLLGVSWIAAYYRVGELLGAPPPEMGAQTTTLVWRGVPSLPGHPRAWRFAFGPTHIPGAPEVRIYVGPTGRLIATEPRDLPSLLNDFRRKGY
jgi:hypothetical protein